VSSEDGENRDGAQTVERRLVPKVVFRAPDLGARALHDEALLDDTLSDQPADRIMIEESPSGKCLTARRTSVEGG
jgi:hypothetical protein